jgi:hypothetical protein
MTTIIALNVQPDTAAPDTEPLNLYKLGMLFTIRCRYWSCRAGNDADELNLTPDRIDARAIASFGTKDLLDPERSRKRFQAIEKKARHALEKCSRPFAAANAHFVPWNQVQTVIERLETLQKEYDKAVQQFIADYPQLRADWQILHPEIPDACYPLPFALSGKFGLTCTPSRSPALPNCRPSRTSRWNLRNAAPATNRSG